MIVCTLYADFISCFLEHRRLGMLRIDTNEHNALSNPSYMNSFSLSSLRLPSEIHLLGFARTHQKASVITINNTPIVSAQTLPPRTRIDQQLSQ